MNKELTVLVAVEYIIEAFLVHHKNKSPCHNYITTLTTEGYAEHAWILRNTLGLPR